MFSALGTRLTLPCIWRLPRLFCSSYQMTRRPLLGTGTRCVTRGFGRVFPGSRDLTKVQCRIRKTITATREVGFAKIWMRKSLGILVRNGHECGIGTLFPDPMLRHCGIFIDQFRNITFLAIPWIIELKILCAPSPQQICGLRFVFLINQDIPGATKETKQVTPSQHGKVT